MMAPSASPVWPAAPRVAPVDAAALAAPLGEDVLAAIQFGGSLADADPRRIRIPLPLAVPGGNAGEIWRVAGGVESRRVSGDSARDGGTFQRMTGGGLAMLCAHVAEVELSRDLEGAVARVYAALLGALRGGGHPYPLRVWNYLSAINDGEGDAERYRRFCVGRYRALPREAGLERLLPAATAIGSQAGNGLLVFALAARQPGTQVENPRQVSAFRYPRDYGRQSPSFSRATWVPWADGGTLYVSGTASIVGHRTVHAGDVVAQLRQAAANVRVLCATAARHAGVDDCRPRSCTVYVRRPDDVRLLLPACRALFEGLQPRIVIGDICRQALGVEIETTCA